MAATRVDFYVLNTNLPGGRLKLTCRVVEKAYKQGNRVLIQTAGREQAMQLDELLWTFRAGSFIPHSLADSTANIASPVIIGTGGIKDVGADLLVNLSDAIPERYKEYGRVAEIIGQEDSIRHQGRERFRKYKEDGCTLETHTITT
jgi:DNA polymerase-3 subunit chi